MDAPLPDGLTERWETFLSTAESTARGSESGVCDAVFEDGMLFPLQRRDEMAAMLRLAVLLNPEAVCEIGVDKGASALHWLLLRTVRRFVGIEIRGVPYGDAFKRAFPETHQLWLAASSYAPETVRVVGDWLGDEMFDVLFIDGDKSAFIRDFDAYLRYVRSGGIVFMHDVRDAAPRIDFERARLHPRVRDSLVLESTIESLYAIYRARQGVAPANAYEGWLRHWRGASCGVGILWV